MASLVSPLPPWKRAIDLAGASFGLLVLSPLLVAVAVLIKLTSRGPVFYRQERFGAHGKPFRIWKFRSMHVDADAEAHRQYVRSLLSQQRPLQKVDRSYRMIPLGSWLRGLAIDELPQLLNVLAGEMSLVGPTQRRSAQGIPALAASPLRRGPGPQRTMAGERQKQDDLRRDGPPRHPLYPTPIPLARSEDPATHRTGDSAQVIDDSPAGPAPA